MIEIKDLLSRFDKILLSEEVKKESLIDVLEKVIGIRLKPEDVRIKDDTAYLNLKPIYKSEILLKKDEILSRLEEAGKKMPQKIV